MNKSNITANTYTPSRRNLRSIKPTPERVASKSFASNTITSTEFKQEEEESDVNCTQRLSNGGRKSAYKSLEHSATNAICTRRNIIPGQGLIEEKLQEES